MLADTAEGGAADVAEEVRRAIEAIAIPHIDNVPSRLVAASIGVSTLTPSPSDTGPEALAAAAALHEAKRTGRNRVVTPRARRALDTFAPDTSAPDTLAPLPFPRRDVA